MTSDPHAYDDGNVFAKILRGEIPCRKAGETEHSLAFHDIRPQAPIHVLVIPKGAYVTAAHFYGTAPEAEIVDFSRLVARLCGELGVIAGGYRLITNAGRDGVQEVPHYHLHILGGRVLGRMLPAAD